jgi:hypothetical protein
MTHQLNAKNKLHNQQHHQSALKYPIMVDKQFNLNQHQLQLMMMKPIGIMKEVIVKN